MGFEQTIIQGNLGRDPELRYTQQGKAVCDFSVAVNRVNDVVAWYRVTTWEALAESCAHHLHKGASVLCVGTVDASAYLDREGQPAASRDLTARSVQFLSTDRTSAPVEPADVGDIPF